MPVIVSQLPSTCTMKEKRSGELSLPSLATPNSTAQSCCSSSLTATENQNCYCKFSLLRSTSPSCVVYTVFLFFCLFFLLHVSVQLHVLFEGGVDFFGKPADINDDWMKYVQASDTVTTVGCYQ